MFIVQALGDNVIKLFSLSSSLTIEQNKLECLTGSVVRLGHTRAKHLIVSLLYRYAPAPSENFD
jgi:hypothetical protein